MIKLANTSTLAGPGIGIDLGTSYSRVSIFRNDKLEVIANDHGKEKTPSYIAFTDTERLFGEAAFDQIFYNPENTIFDVKNLIGKGFSDKSVQSLVKNCPYKLCCDKVGEPRIQAEYKKRSMLFRPEEILAMVLQKMKETAEEYLERTISYAVITVPAHFNYVQRQIIKDAAAVAELTVLRILNDSSAAGIFYTMNIIQPEKSAIKHETKAKTVFIYDHGASNVNVTICSVENRLMKILATAGEEHLGGNDFDDVMVAHFSTEFQNLHNKDISGNKCALSRLRVHCEKAKRILSFTNNAKLTIYNLVDGIDFCLSITRDRFEDLTHHIFCSVDKFISKTLANCHIERSSITDVILVGGSSRIPMIGNILCSHFGEIVSKSVINADSAIVSGAAIQAALLSGEKSVLIKNMHLVDSTPYRLGIETESGGMETIIKKYNSIGTTQAKMFGKDVKLPGRSIINVYEGDSTLAKGNLFLAQLILTPNKLRENSENISVTFDLDANSSLVVKAAEISSGEEISATVGDEIRRRRSDILKEMIQVAHDLKMDDIQESIRVLARNRLEYCCIVNKGFVKQECSKQTISEAKGEFVLDRCRDMIQWLDNNKQATKEDFDEKRKILELICSPIIHRNEMAKRAKFM